MLSHVVIQLRDNNMNKNNPEEIINDLFRVAFITLGVLIIFIYLFT